MHLTVVNFTMKTKNEIFSTETKRNQLIVLFQDNFISSKNVFPPASYLMIFFVMATW